jgi:hypothetical protein
MRTMRRHIAVLVLLSAGALPRVAAEGGRPAFGLDGRLWGLDCSLSYAVAEPREASPTRLWLAAGGGFEEASLYRSFEGTDTVGLHTDPPVEHNTAAYKNLNADVAVGVSQDLSMGVHVLSAFLLGTFRYEHHDPSWAPEALIFDSALPDRTDLLENGILLGALLRKGIPSEKAGLMFPLVYSIEASLRAHPRFLANTASDYARLSVIGILLLQLANARLWELYVATRLGFDSMWGTAFPVHARTTVGGIGAPYFTLNAALGDTVRGIAAGRFDGTTKLYGNLEARLRFPISSLIVPLATLFFDSGVSDYRGLDHAVSASDILYTAGINLAADVARVAQIGYMLSYAFNEPDLTRRFGYGVTLSAHF